MRVLLTGGLGYIGSHVAVELSSRGHEPVIVDNLCNAKVANLDKVACLSPRKPRFYNADICEFSRLEQIFRRENFDAVIHLAGLKSVNESFKFSCDYYRNNVGGQANLLKLCDKHAIAKFIFSSSATIYGDGPLSPISEQSSAGKITNPYVRTKVFCESMLRDYCSSNHASSVLCLRYFNPVGAHSSGTIGEDLSLAPTNLFPLVAEAHLGLRDSIAVFGSDYPTPDGTCLRDYIHVVDLAHAHVKALEISSSGFVPLNLGTGRPYSVKEVLGEFEAVTGRSPQVIFDSRREGDVCESWADPTAANKLLDWKAKLQLHDMVADAWRWFAAVNPDRAF